MSEVFTRRKFLEFSAGFIGDAILGFPLSKKGLSMETGLTFVNDRVLRTPEGLIPVTNYKVIPGDTVTKIADLFQTKPEFLDSRMVVPDQMLRVPKYPRDPMRFIPEMDIVRHRVKKGENKRTIANMYGISEKSFNSFFWTGSTIVIHNPDIVPLVPVKIMYPTEGNYLSRAVVESLIQRVAHVFDYHVSDLSYIKKTGVKIGYGNPGFSGPSGHIEILMDDTISEAEILNQLGHELWHQMPFPWWSTGADEGTAHYVAEAWLTGDKQYVSQNPNILKSYNSLNTFNLRNRKFSDREIENRILATEAWRRIETNFPGVIAYLTKASPATSDDATPITVVQNFIENRFGSEGWDFVNSQHILFTK